MTEIEYAFDGPADARAYLREVGTLWAVWIVGLAAVMFTHGVTLIIVAAALLVSLLMLARPLLPRTEILVPENRRGGTTRDRVLRELAYGVAPMEAALDTAGYSPRWIVVRHLVIALTVLAFIGVIVVPVL